MISDERQMFEDVRKDILGLENDLEFKYFRRFEGKTFPVDIGK